MSLRTFHLIFMLIAIMGADLFGAWAIHEYHNSGDGLTLALGIISLVGGLGLCGYIFWFIRKAKLAHLD